MKRSFFFFSLSFLFFALYINAQELSVDPNPASQSYGQLPIIQSPIPVTITHSNSLTVASGSVACGNQTAPPFYTSQNSYWRAFNLPSFSIVGNFTVSNVTIGIENANATSGTQSLTVTLYTSSQAFPTGAPGSLTQIGTATVNVPNQNLTTLQIPVVGVAPAGSELVVEINSPNGQPLADNFFIGSNSLGQTGPSYISASSCGIGTPTNLASIGFANMHIVMTVSGEDDIPVELTSFAASVTDRNVTLNWTTATEVNNQGFEVQKQINGEYKTIGFVNGNGTTTEAQSYSYVDNNLPIGSYIYRLKQVDFDGTFEYSPIVEVDVLTPGAYALEQNYPNPFNPSTKINFSLASESKVTLKVFDVLGQEITTLINGNLAAQIHSIDFNASGLNSGVYFYTIEAIGIDGTNFNQTMKMILTK